MIVSFELSYVIIEVTALIYHLLQRSCFLPYKKLTVIQYSSDLFGFGDYEGLVSCIMYST